MGGVKSNEWQSVLEQLPPNLSQAEAARFLGLKHTTVRRWLILLGYQFKDGRASSWTIRRRRSQMKFIAERADWSLPNIVIAKKFKVSRERVRQVRAELGKKKVNGRK